MREEIINTKAVTIRVPEDLLSEIDSRASKLEGRGTRTEVMLNLMRKALGLPIPIISQSLERTDLLENKVEKIERELAELRQEFKQILQSNTAQDIKQTEKLQTQPDISQKEEKNTENKQLNINDAELQPPKTMHQDTDISEVLTPELFKVLRQEDSESTWHGDKIRNYRQGKKKNQWHEVGKIRFKYKGENPKMTSPRNRHIWLLSKI